MFEELFHKITFGIFRKKDDPAAAKVDVQVQVPPLAAAQGKAPAPVPALAPAAQGKALPPPLVAAPQVKAPALDSVDDALGGKQDETPDLKSSQFGGGRRRRRGSRGSRGSRSKSKRGGFQPGDNTHQAMGFGRAGGSGHRRSKKRNTQKRRK
jgi:hypothetical protein